MKSLSLLGFVALILVMPSSSAVLAASLTADRPAIVAGGRPHSPHLGSIDLGAFAPEAARHYGIDDPCLMTFEDGPMYVVYRNSIRATYGADLSDMNYLGVGMPDWEIRYQWLRDWLFLAAKYGDPTIALEPLGDSKYGVFQDSPEMRDLRSVFAKANHAGITVWVRFCSEANDDSNPYNVVNSPDKVAQYRSAVRWFRAYMPSNVRLVFCPLINDVGPQYPAQLATIRAMYAPGDYDRIGGTIYATSWVDPEQAYSWYYDFMTKIDPNTRFQISELGGTFTKKHEVYTFLADLIAGKWPKVDRVNLFAGELNSQAIENHGHFGLVLPGETASYLRPLIVAGLAAPARVLAAAPPPLPPARIAMWKSAGLSFRAAAGRRIELVELSSGSIIAAAQSTAPILTKQVAPPVIPVAPISVAVAAETSDSDTADASTQKHPKGWRSDEMTLKGTTIAASSTYHTFVMMVTEVTNSSGDHVTFSPARKKRVYLQADAMITTPSGLINRSQIASLKGTVTQVTGVDQGEGTPLQAYDVLVTTD